jgi:peptidoglycan/LPS O-acetylase OafA/YrhL
VSQPVAGPDRLRLPYLPALDGLRAVAVGAVLLYHAGVGAAGGGFLGVDLFLVLSGYLITTLLLLEHDSTGRIDLPAFWARRARRLLPALFAAVAAVAVVAPFVLSRGQFDRVREDGLATLLYVANWRLIISGQSYFEQFGEPSPFRHTWSLAIEEQWYLLWPIVLSALVVVWRRRAALAVALVLAGAAASAILMAALSGPGSDLSRAYYGTDTRAQSLLVGAALALVLRRRPLTGPVVQVAGVAGAGACLALLATVDDFDLWMYSGGFLLLALSTAALIMAAVAPGGGMVARALSLPPLPAIGRISYGLYLWHWPVYIVLTSGRIGLSGTPLVLLRVAATVVVSLASYSLLEMPVRRGAFSGSRARWATGSAALVTVVAVVAVGAVARPPAEPSAGLVQVFAEPPDPDATRVLLVGDSAAFTLGSAFPYDELRPRVTLDALGVLGCGVVLGRPYAGDRGLTRDPKCPGVFDDWRDKVTDFDPEVSVIMAGAWEVVDHQVDGRVLRVGTDEYRRHLLQRLDEGLDILTRGGRSPAVLLGVPCYGRSRSAVDARIEDARSDVERTSWVDGVFREAAAAHAGVVTFVDLAAYLCPAGRYVAELQGVPLRGDGVHFTAEGGRVLWHWLAPQLERLAPPG